ncbi:MAG: tetratricopeptide repeat protein [Nostoc sp.]|uniref:tetratricopeptide repeat protein n=1 Tax=Nostoc sp. TaxID=1180 RepID=UPI002FF5B830
MNQDNFGGENFYTNTGDNNVNFFGGEHHHYYSSFHRSSTGIAHNLPYSGVTEFVGREEDLKQLHEQLRQSNTVAISAISGMGGIGKTELALQYALKHLELQTYSGGICWLRTREDIGTQLVSFARLDDLEPPDELGLLEQVKWCWQHWREGEVLVILDDVQDYQTLKPFLPPPELRFKRVLTTRQTFGSPVRNFEIKVLTEDAALNLLRAIATDERIDKQLEQAKALCAWLGYLPLGLELVGRYLARKPDVSIDKLLKRLEEKRLDAKALKDAEPEMTAPLGLAAAFELSWQELTQEAQELAGFLSLFALAEIPWWLVQTCWQMYVLEMHTIGFNLLPKLFMEAFLQAEDNEELEDIRDEMLINPHLLQRTGEGYYQLHQLLREFFGAKRQQMSKEPEMKRSLCWIMAAVAEQIPQKPTLSEIEQIAPVIPHIEETVITLEPWLSNEEFIRFSRITCFYQGQAAFIEAMQWIERCLEIAKVRFGESHVSVADLLNIRGIIYREQGHYSEAEALYQKSLRIRQQQLGDSHPDLGVYFNNLALLYHKQGRYSEAEQLYQKSLECLQNQSGDAQLLATTFHNLAELYYLQGRYFEAESLGLRSLDIRQQQLGNNHPDVAQSLNNLAQLYTLEQRYSEAEPLGLRSLEIRQQQLGNNHPDVAMSLYTLATLYIAQERHSEAEALYLRSIEIYKQKLGNTHQETAESLSALAGLYTIQDRYSEAESLYLECLTIFESSLGKAHPATQNTSKLFIALVMRAIKCGRITEFSNHLITQAMLPQALETLRQELGENNIGIAACINNVAKFYCHYSNYSQAEPLYQKALSISQQQLGDYHPDTTRILNNLADFYYSQNRYAEAEPLCRRSLEISRQLLGDSHPNMAKKFNDLAYLIYMQQRYSEAEPLYQQALKIDQQQLGKCDTKIIVTLDNLTRLYRFQGNYRSAELVYAETLTLIEDRLGQEHPYFQSIYSDFFVFLANTLQLPKVTELSNHPLTQSLLVRSLEVIQQQLGDKHPGVAATMNNLAEFYRVNRYYSQAEPLYIQALTIIEDQLGQGHPSFQTAWHNIIMFLIEVIQANRKAELSDHPVTQMLLQYISPGS